MSSAKPLTFTPGRKRLARRRLQLLHRSFRHRLGRSHGKPRWSRGRRCDRRQSGLRPTRVLDRRLHVRDADRCGAHLAGTSPRLACGKVQPRHSTGIDGDIREPGIESMANRRRDRRFNRVGPSRHEQHSVSRRHVLPLCPRSTSGRCRPTPPAPNHAVHDSRELDPRRREFDNFVDCAAVDRSTREHGVANYRRSHSYQHPCHTRAERGDAGDFTRRHLVDRWHRCESPARRGHGQRWRLGRVESRAAGRGDGDHCTHAQAILSKRGTRWLGPASSRSRPVRRVAHPSPRIARDSADRAAPISLCKADRLRPRRTTMCRRSCPQKPTGGKHNVDRAFDSAWRARRSCLSAQQDSAGGRGGPPAIAKVSRSPRQ